MSRPIPAGGRLRLCLLTVAAALAGAGIARAYGPQGFNTVIVDPGHGGLDRGGGPGQRIPEKIYTLDTSLRLARALRSRGFRVVMTRTSDVFIPLRDRVAIANSYSGAIFVSVHYNSAPRVGAQGFETYYYRSDSFGLASRLHQAQLRSASTEDRFVRRRGFYVVRNLRIPGVLCEGGFLTNPEESRRILSGSYRQQWADQIADAILAQRQQGNPSSLSSPPRVTSERLTPRRSGRSRRHAVVSRRHRSSAGKHQKSSSTRHRATKKKARRH